MYKASIDNLRYAQIKCGSGLAREEVITVDINVDCQSAFASKPAPTESLCWPRKLWPTGQG
ncbi:hypothetical protein C5612_10220 [Pseudomonas frederiksbergensis]|uniref:Uncharacterized protein n=1 Tax=Pseudomonas frederiksbergensis TaxID=104087 RepID=A0A2S8HQ78_9PSED|nr:hypothetical protein C5612_10220 [Pseudomonas frederiksbergensis]